MALVYPGYNRPEVPPSSLAYLLQGFEEGQNDRADSNAFDAAASAFGTPGTAPQSQAQPSFLERLVQPFSPRQTAASAIESAVPSLPSNALPGNTQRMGNSDPAMSAYYQNARAAESGGNDLAKNPNSTATGRYQFLESTWNGLAKQYPELGLTPGGRTDPVQQERAMERFTQDNARALSGAGIPVNPGNLYAAHFLGAGGAQQVLTQDPSAPLSSYLQPGVADANPHLNGMTVGDFINWSQSKGGNSSGGYAPPMRNEGQVAGARPFSVDGETLRALLASEATRPLAQSLITAQQETEATRGRFVTEQGQDGSIWQRDTLTGQMSILREPPQAQERQMIEGPDGNMYYVDDGSRVLPGVDPIQTGARPLTPEERVQWGIPDTDMRPYAIEPGQAPTPVGGSGQTINVNTAEGQDAALNKALSETEGKLWADYKSTGTVSSSNAQDFQVLDELIGMAPQGAVQGRLAAAFPGFNSAGDAFQSIVKRIAPTLRAPGSGATSDIEYAGMLQSLPALQNDPAANRMILSIMRAKAEINMQRADVITQYQADGDADAARQKLAELDRVSILTPEMRQALIGVGGDGQTNSATPAIGEIVEGYEFLGGNPADMNSWKEVQ